MDYLIIALVVLANASSLIVRAFPSARGKCNAFLFTSVAALAAAVFFFCYNGFGFSFDTYTMCMALLFAAAYLTCGISSVCALKHGSVAITSMISSLSLMLPTVFGVVYWKEPVTPAFVLGIVLFCVSVVLVNIKGKKSGAQKGGYVSVKPIWLVFVFLVFVSNGTCSIIQTYHQKTGGTPYKAELMIMALLVVFAVNAVISVVMLKKELVPHLKAITPYGVGYGILNGCVNLGVMLLASNGVVGQSVYFPIVSVGTLVLVFAASLAIFRERFRPVQYVGVLCGVVTIVLLQM